jgi:hypothetical protein
VKDQPKPQQQPAPSAKFENNSDYDAWGGWSENSEDVQNADYERLNLNKLGDKELAKHKKAMDTDFNKNKVWKDHPDFEYDKRKDFTRLRQTSSPVENW